MSVIPCCIPPQSDKGYLTKTDLENNHQLSEQPMSSSIIRVLFYNNNKQRITFADYARSLSVFRPPNKGEDGKEMTKKKLRCKWEVGKRQSSSVLFNMYDEANLGYIDRECLETINAKLITNQEEWVSKNERELRGMCIVGYHRRTTTRRGGYEERWEDHI